MKIIIRLTALCSFLFFTTVLLAQHTDSVLIMSYNVGNFGKTKGGCPLLTPAKKSPYLRTIIKYANPDIAGFVKMNDDATFDTSTVVHSVLDSVCAGCWGHSTYTNKSGYNRNNILYFKTSKFGFISTTTLYASDPNISDINLHRLFYKSPSLGTTHDTIFLNIVLVHDLSGSSSTSDRATEIGGAMTALKSIVKAPGNYIFMGDFNTQSSSEFCYQDMVDSTNGNVRFYDPIHKPGNWDSYPSLFAKYLTNTSRVTDPGDCLASGGLADRFDHILCTGPLLYGTDSMQYIPNSYIVLGNSGNLVGKSVNDTSNHLTMPKTVLDALYYMSEHLPVVSKFAISKQFGSGTQNYSMPALSVQYNTLVTDYLNIYIANNTPSSHCTINIYTLQGQLIKCYPFDINAPSSVPIQTLSQGLYIWRIVQNNIPLFTGRFVKLNK